ncbi:peptidoglycan DD-metalloendopeptidase family protein [Streptomyces sp.]|uniref:peptidoglycan DD-metalloendopeptidase family protein n=1 Tax=Streptomyces sp. TaxID=1931 RepID=UPI002F4270F6
MTGPGARARPGVLRAFEPPPTPWSAGHRGVDLSAAPAAPVRAAAPGEVTFTGRVAGTPVLVLRHAGGLRTTYQPVRADLLLGTRVPAGARLGTVAGSPVPHCPVPCLHWGLLRDDGTYLDPLSLLPSSLRQPGRSRLLPVHGGGRGT